MPHDHAIATRTSVSGQTMKHMYGLAWLCSRLTVGLESAKNFGQLPFLPGWTWGVALPSGQSARQQSCCNPAGACCLARAQPFLAPDVGSHKDDCHPTLHFTVICPEGY